MHLWNINLCLNNTTDKTSLLSCMHSLGTNKYTVSFMHMYMDWKLTNHFDLHGWYSLSILGLLTRGLPSWPSSLSSSFSWLPCVPWMRGASGRICVLYIVHIKSVWNILGCSSPWWPPPTLFLLVFNPLTFLTTEALNFRAATLTRTTCGGVNWIIIKPFYERAYVQVRSIAF